MNLPSELEHPSELSMLRYKTLTWDDDDSLRDVISRLPKYSKIPNVLDCPIMELKLALLDNVAAPTEKERTLLRQVTNPS